MNDTIRFIVNLLESGKPDLQVAAAQILGELRPKEPAVLKALESAVPRSHVLGRFCLDALAKIGTLEALECIAARLRDNESLADHAVHLLSEAGPAAHSVLARAYEESQGDQRGRILAILARALTRESLAVFVKALLTPELTESTARLLLAAADQFEPQLQKQLREGLGKHLNDSLPEACLVQVIGVLARVDAAGSRATLMRFVAPTYGAGIRQAAYRALQGTRFTAAQIKGMLDMLLDPAQRGVHDALREVLAAVPEVPEGLEPVLKQLLAGRDPEQRLFALRMLRTVGGAELAKVALKLLDHADPRFRTAAAEALAHNRHAVEPLLRVVQTARDPEVARLAAQVLTRLAPTFSPKLLRTMADKVVKLMPSNPRTGDLLFDVVIAAGGSKIAPVFVDKSVKLRRARRYGEALRILARLATTAYVGDEGRYQIGLTKLLQDMAHPGEAGASPGNATMGFFAALVREGFPLAERLRKEAAVTPDALLHVATHFASAVGTERRFGTELLQHLAGRAKGRASEEARMTLRAVGG